MALAGQQVQVVNSSLLQEGFEFKKPTKPVSRPRLRSFNGGRLREAFACRPSSAPALMVRTALARPPARVFLTLTSVPQLSSPPFMQQLDVYDSSPVFRRRSSNDDEDDGFLEVLDDVEVSRPRRDCPVLGRPTGSP